MNFRDYVAVFRERWLLVTLGLVFGISGGSAIALLSTPQYTSGVTFFVSTPTASGQDAVQAYQGSLLSAQKIKSYTQLATGPRLREQVERELGEQVGPGAISAVAQPGTVLLDLTVTDPSPRRAQAIARVAARAFAALVAEVERPVKGGAPAVAARVVQPAMLPAVPVSPRPLRDLTLGALLGLLAGAGTALGRHVLDRTLKSLATLADVVGAPVLGTTVYDAGVRSRPLIVHDQPQAPLAEAFRHLRTNLQYVDLDHARKLIVVTSPLAEEGKTTTTCNLAIALAQAGCKVAVVEADLRRPRAAAYLGMENAIGLTSVLTGAVTLEHALQPWGGGILDFLGAGGIPPNPSELLASDRMGRVLDELNERYDVVLFDSPPVLPVADAAILAARCHGALLVARHGKSTVDQARAAAEALQRVSATLFGAVLTMAPRSKRHSEYAYQYGYASADEPRRPAPPISSGPAEPRPEPGPGRPGHRRVPTARAVPAAAPPAVPAGGGGVGGSAS